MKTIISSVIFAATAFSTALIPSTASAQARGNEGSGGGTAIVCREKDYQFIQKAILLDTYEWPKDYALKLVRVPKTGNQETDARLFDEELNKLLNQKILQLPYNVSFKRMLTAEVNDVKEKIFKAIQKAKAESSDTYIYAPSDIGMARPVRIPRGCTLDHVVFYTNSALDINPEIWNAFDITDRVALVTHEAIYALNRALFGHKDSALSREQTAILVALAHDSTNEYKFYDILGSGEFGAFRSIVASRTYYGNVIRLSFQKPVSNETVRVKIRLFDLNMPEKVSKTDVIDVEPGKTAELKIGYEWSKVEITVLKETSKSKFGENMLWIESVSAKDAEIETAAVMRSREGDSGTLQNAELTQGYFPVFLRNQRPLR